MAWLFADVPASIPTAVFGARASSREDSKLGAGADSWLEGVAESSPTFSALEDALVARVGFEAQAGDFAAVADTNMVVLLTNRRIFRIEQAAPQTVKDIYSPSTYDLLRPAQFSH